MQLSLQCYSSPAGVSCLYEILVLHLLRQLISSSSHVVVPHPHNVPRVSSPMHTIAIFCKIHFGP